MPALRASPSAPSADLGKHVVDHAAEIRRHGDLRLEGAGEQALLRRLVDMDAVGGHPAAAAGQVSLDVRNDGPVRADDETDQLIRLGSVGA